MISGARGLEVRRPEGQQRIRPAGSRDASSRCSRSSCSQANGKYVARCSSKRSRPGNVAAAGQAVPGRLERRPRGRGDSLSDPRDAAPRARHRRRARSSPMSRSRSREGEFLGIIGPNGAGKTSLFNLLSGLLPADARARSSSTAGTSPATRPTGARRPGSAARSRSRASSRCLTVLRERAARGRGRSSAGRCGSGGGRTASREAVERARWALGRVGLGARERGARRRALARRQAQARAGDAARRRPARDPARRADGRRLAPRTSPSSSS